jgi:hypothetical protein
MSTFENTCEVGPPYALSAFDNVGSTGFTVCGWIKFDAIQEGQITLWFVTWSGFYIGCEFSGQPSGPPLPGYLRMWSQAGSEVLVPYPDDGAWHFYRAWLGTDGKLHLQVDAGVALESVAEVYPDSACSAFQLQGDTTAIPDDKNGFDETGFWKRVLSDPEAAALYNGGAGITWGNPAMPP